MSHFCPTRAVLVYLSREDTTSGGLEAADLVKIFILLCDILKTGVFILVSTNSPPPLPARLHSITFHGLV
jgi:hypothetical protein